jgi:hypothetical protein
MINYDEYEEGQEADVEDPCLAKEACELPKDVPVHNPAVCSRFSSQCRSRLVAIYSHAPGLTIRTMLAYAECAHAAASFHDHSKNLILVRS